MYRIRETMKHWTVIIRQTLLLFLAGVFILGCEKHVLSARGGSAIQPGDLLFQDQDCGPLCDAIEKVTTGYQGADFSHVGIAAKDDSGRLVVIEAVSSGVQITPLQTFLARSLDETGRPKVAVGRLKAPYRHLIPSAIKEAFSLRGRPYDKLFAFDNGAYYCSELIYEVFRRANGDIPVFAARPMTFKDPNTGRTDPVWRQYFKELGVPVPEGRPGINPGGLSCSGALTMYRINGTPNLSRLSPF
jgi:Permuted papain-like amidase enzyme, YaeF/YiiX, C92 family